MICRFPLVVSSSIYYFLVKLSLFIYKMNEKQLNLRLPESEMQILIKYAKKTGRTKTDVIREFIRSLKDSV